MSLSEDQAINEKLEAENDKLLLELSTVYNFVKENEVTRSIRTQTINDYIQTAIDEIQGPTKNGRASKLEKLDQIEQSLDALVKALN
jgi:hypothetical protein